MGVQAYHHMEETLTHLASGSMTGLERRIVVSRGMRKSPAHEESHAPQSQDAFVNTRECTQSWQICTSSSFLCLACIACTLTLHLDILSPPAASTSAYLTKLQAGGSSRQSSQNMLDKLAFHAGCQMKSRKILPSELVFVADCGICYRG